MNFDESNNRLQEIIKQLEKNDVSIEEGTKLYEEGVLIAKNCYETLKKNKGKVMILKEELENLSEIDEI